jgi:small subunit ribosomal protein S16
MSVVIRMTRFGRTNRPFFRIGVYDVRTRREGVAIETLGYYDPIAVGQAKPLEYNEERMKYWLSQGAAPSETIATFLRKAKIPYKNTVAVNKRNRERQAKRLAKKKQAKAAAKSA